MEQELDEWGNPIPKNPSYTDNDGNKLFGFSVEDVKGYNNSLNRNTKWLKIAVVLQIIIIIMVIIGYWYVKHYNIVSYPVGLMREVITKCALG